jgi:osmotically-inducible protein OsmY
MKQSSGNDKTKALDKDAAVRDRVAEALGEHPETSDAVIEVIAERGIVTLEGTVDSVEARTVAARVAAAQPDVISVTNSLRVAG